MNELRVFHLGAFLHTPFLLFFFLARPKSDKAMPPKKRDEKKEEEEAKPQEDSGTFVFEDGAKYTGQVIRREGAVRRHGRGTYVDEVMSYDGEWKEDSMCGEAVVTFHSGAKYTGAVLDNRFEGRGVYKWPDGSFYDGQWRYNRMHGEGTYCDSDGQMWHGRFYSGTGPGLVKAPELLKHMQRR